MSTESTKRTKLTVYFKDGSVWPGTVSFNFTFGANFDKTLFAVPGRGDGEGKSRIFVGDRVSYIDLEGLE